MPVCVFVFIQVQKCNRYNCFFNVVCSGGYSPQTAVIPEEDRLYFVHFFSKTVEVARLDGSERRVLIQSQATWLRGVAVDPVAR